MTDYILTRSNRKTVALYIRNGYVEVRAPLKISKRDIDKFVASKEKWITDKLAQLRERSEKRSAFTINYGDMISFRGAEYPITTRSGTMAGFDGEVFYMPPGFTPDQIKAFAIQIYRRLAKIHLSERMAHFSMQMNVMPAAVKINGAKTRWGSCSSRKNINFSWRLILADDAVIDYVIVHELAHITEMNHSVRFWAIIEGVLPNYRELQKRLKALQHRLNVEDWE